MYMYALKCYDVTKVSHFFGNYGVITFASSTGPAFNSKTPGPGDEAIYRHTCLYIAEAPSAILTDSTGLQR